MKTIYIIGEVMPGLIRAFMENDYEVYKIDFNRLISLNEIPDYCFSFDFDIDISKWCIEHQVNYISWVYDSPHLPLYSKVVEDKHNIIFLFDRNESIKLNKYGLKNVFYLPLATDVKYHKGNIGSLELNNEIDVSFMGNLYDDIAYDRIAFLPEYIQGYLDGIIKAQIDLWGIDVFDNIVSDDIVEEIISYVQIVFENEYNDKIMHKSLLDSMIGKKVAQIERRKMCDMLSSKYTFLLCSGSDTTYNKNIKNIGYIDYKKEMPIIFYNSKINLNHTLHCISSGIPLRVLDILACGGFCLTNYQSEIVEYFIDGEELVIYSDFDDMLDKIDYYLLHDEERKAIAKRGYLKVRRFFDYGARIPQLISKL